MRRIRSRWVMRDNLVPPARGYYDRTEAGASTLQVIGYLYARRWLLHTEDAVSRPSLLQ
jgi:DNA-binding PadR family transcriptional regulator